MDRMLILTVVTVLSFLIIPTATANPMPLSVWGNAQAGGSPEPKDGSGNVTFFKEDVRADVGKTTVKVRADYWFRNEGTENGSIEIFLPLSKDPQDIDLEADGLQTGWYRSSYLYESKYEYYTYQAIVFTLFFMPSEERKVTVEYRDDLSIYDTSLNDHVSYFFSYLVGSARAWNRSLESARFEFKVPRSMWDRGEYDGWDRSREGWDYVFTKEYSDWTPEGDLEYLNWEKDRVTLSNLLSKYPHIAIGIAASASVIVVGSMVLVIATVIRKARARKGPVPIPSGAK